MRCDAAIVTSHKTTLKKLEARNNKEILETTFTSQFKKMLAKYSWEIHLSHNKCSNNRLSTASRYSYKTAEFRWINVSSKNTTTTIRKLFDKCVAKENDDEKNDFITNSHNMLKQIQKKWGQSSQKQPKKIIEESDSKKVILRRIVCLY